MIAIDRFRDMTVAVFGLGATGLSAVRALAAGDARVAAWDDNPDARAKLATIGVEPVDLTAADFGDFAALVLSPGVPLTHPRPHWSVDKARQAGIPVIGDTELFVQALASSGADAALVAITGTNGKSTTTALIGHLLATAGRDAHVGGNIGRTVLDLPEPANGRIYVVEFSSYQIDLTPSLHPRIAILLNLSPDHLDRHGDMAGYAAVKERIFACQGPGDTAIVGVDDVESAAIAGRVPAGATLVRISNRHAANADVFAEDAVIRVRDDGAIVDLDGISTVRGVHNWQNAAAAVAAVRALGLRAHEIARGIATFPGLKHRMEEVGRIGPVAFINDSKATNADAAARALACFQRIYWIAGGRPKSDGIAPLSAFFRKIVRAYLIGEAAEAFGRTLDGAVDAVQCGTLEAAVRHAAKDALADAGAEPVVLLSPACASFDQFPNFEARGDAFRALVAGLDGVSMKQEVAA